MSDSYESDRYDSDSSAPDSNGSDSPSEDDCYDTAADDPLKGKSTLGKPMTPIAPPKRRGWFVASRVMLGLFFALVILLIIIVLIDRTLYKSALALALFAFTALSGFFACSVINNRRYCRNHTVGLIVDIRRQINFRAPPTYVPRIEYTVKGLIYRIWGPGSSKPPVFHAKMDVYYDPENPENATFRIGKRSTMIVCIVLTALLLAGGVLVLCL